MKKILALVLCLVMMVSVFSAVANAATAVATLVAADLGLANAVEFTEKKVDSITFAAAIGTSQNAPKYYTSGTALRFYKGNTLTITPDDGCTIVSIEITAAGASYGLDGAGVTLTNATNSGNTITPVDGTKPIVITNDEVNSNQMRIVSIAVTYSNGGPACQHPNTEVKYDATGHWTVCSDCKVVTADKAAHTLSNGTCSGCAISTLTISEANAKAVEAGSSYTSIGYLVSGTIKSVANTKYGNMTIMDAEGNELYLYGTYDVDGKSYENMETKPVAGDSITVYTVLGTYTKNDVTTNQGKSATIIAHTPHTHDSNGEVAKNETHHWATCSLCGAKQGEEIGHTYTNGTCSCGAVDPEYVPIVVEDGTYIIASGNLAMTGLAADKNYGYPGAHEIGIAAGVASGFAKNDIITITNVTGGITLQDSQGRYLYMTGSYNNFNVSAELPEAGHIWSITKNEDGTYVLVNLSNNKTLAYSTQYTSYGAYSPLTDDHASAMTIIAVSESDATGDPIAVVLGLLAVSGMGIVVLKKKEF